VTWALSEGMNDFFKKYDKLRTYHVSLGVKIIGF
jgi:hypothetical protein